MEAMDDEDIESKINSIRDLEKLIEYFQSQNLNAEEATKLNRKNLETADIENIESNAVDLEQTLQIKQIHKEIIEKLGFTNELAKAHFGSLNSEENNIDALQAQAEQQKIRENLQIHNKYNEEILELVNDTTALQFKQASLQKKLNNTVKANQEKLKLLEYVQNSAQQDEITKRENDDTGIAQVKSRYLEELKELRIIKHTFQSLITACNIDWFIDEDMKKLYLSLGQETVPKFYQG